ncbi:MAG: LysR family transcriptional regulator [Pseudomonadota bacterium]
MQDFDIYRIDGHTLRVFASVCETGSVSRTADRFQLNQSTISHSIDKFRAAVGDPLFVKSGRGITPTERAFALLPQVQRLLADIEGLVASQSYDPSIESRPFGIAIPTPSLLSDMKILHAFLSDRAPQAKLRIRRQVPRDRVMEIIGEDEIDAVISVSGYQYPTTLAHCTYGSDRLSVFYDPRCRGPINSLDDYAEARHGVVSFGGQARSEVENLLLHHEIRRKIALVAPTASMLGGLIQGTDVVATMPHRLSEYAYAGLAHCDPPVPFPPIKYDLVWHRRYEHSGRNQWFRNLILEAGTSARAASG